MAAHKSTTTEQKKKIDERIKEKEKKREFKE